jgi:hypothetical protein
MHELFSLSLGVITDPAYYASFKARSLAAQDLTLNEKYHILEALYREARQLGSFGERDLLVGLEDDVRLAAALNANVSVPPR